MRRRSFLTSPIALSLAAPAGAAAAVDERVYTYGDGIPHTPADYSQLLARLTSSGAIEADDYSRGGIVEKLEGRMAALLGKETAVWLPTGTLANHLAVRLLAGDKRRVLVQAESHLYNDTGDCAQTLSGLTLIPLARGSATFSLEDAERAASDAQHGRVATAIGAIQIETPVRRRIGERFDFEQMTRISRWARERRIGLHLDGARLFLESAYMNRPVSEYAALFDTVYISQYKYFNAASGAILAGPKALLGELYQQRRMFGGGLNQVWPMAAVAHHYLEGFEQSFRTAKAASEQVIAALSNDASFSVERIANGTNLFRLRVHGVNPPVYQTRLAEAGIEARTPAQEWFTMQVNPTWTRLPTTEIVTRFRKALG
jgi:threonine aldolase